MYDILGFIFRYSIWHYMELLKRARKGDEWAVEALAEGISPLTHHQHPFSLDEILNLMDENEKQLISQFEDNYSIALNTPVSDDDLPF